MSKRKKTVIFFIIIAISFSFILPFLPKTVEMRIHVEAESITEPAILNYSYMMSAPIAVAADGEIIYALDGHGNIVDINDKAVFDVRLGAKKFAVSSGVIATDIRADCIAVFAGKYAAEMTPSALFIGEGDEQIAVSPEDNHTFAAGAIDGNTIYATTNYTNGGLTKHAVFKYALSNDNARTLIKNEIKTDGEIIAMTILKGDIYLATPYSLYRVGKSSAIHVGGITSLTNDGTKLYYTSKSGEICTFDGTSSQTLLSGAEKVTAATRKNFAIFTNKGNNKITAISDGATISASIEQPVSTAVDYAGNIYAASENKVKIFTRGLEYVGAESDLTFGNAYDHIKEIKIDNADVTGCTLYALSNDGILGRNFDDKTASDVARVEISADGVVFGMKKDGSIVRYSDSLSEETLILASGDFVDFAIDQGGNIYRATAQAIYKNDESEPIANASNIMEICISAVNLMRNGNNVGYGDMIVVTESDCQSLIIPRSIIGTDMRDDKSDSDYNDFIQKANEKTPNEVSYPIDLRKALTPSDVYDFPAETPVSGNRDLEVGAYLIVIERYKNTAYCYAIAETSKGSIKGFVNINTLSSTLACDLLIDGVCTPVKTAGIYKYPSQDAPIIGETVLGQAYNISPFVEAYRDASGREWCRISFKTDNGDADGYVLRTNMAINGHTGGYNKDLYADAVIKASDGFAVTYIDGEGKYEMGKITDGTPIKLEEAFNKSREFTEITYVSDESTGATTTCFVRTEFIKHTEAGWYQVIFFIIGGVVIVAIAIIIVIRVRRKRKID